MMRSGVECVFAAILGTECQWRAQCASRWVPRRRRLVGHRRGHRRPLLHQRERDFRRRYSAAGDTKRKCSNTTLNISYKFVIFVFATSMLPTSFFATSILSTSLLFCYGNVVKVGFCATPIFSTSFFWLLRQVCQLRLFLLRHFVLILFFVVLRQRHPRQIHRVSSLCGLHSTTPETRMSIAPSVASQISGPVVVSCTSGLAGFLNCCGM